MAKLNQIIAVEKGVKSKAYSEITELNKLIQKPQLFNGFSKTYDKKDEGSEDLPAEKARVQYSVEDILKSVERSMSELIDTTARKDYTNCEAKADVVVDGKVIVPKAPVSFLLFLEKTLTDLKTLVGNLPILDEAESWKFDTEAQLYKSDSIKTHRTKKVQKPIVLYDATDKHPAQTQLITEDVIVGYWNTIKMSGAMTKLDKSLLSEKVETVLKAVKEAREAANVQEEVSVPKIASNLFDFLMGE